MARQEASRSRWSVVDRNQMETPSLTMVVLAHCKRLGGEAALHTQASSAVVHNILVVAANRALVACYNPEWLHKKTGLDQRAGCAVLQARAHEASFLGFP